jgi:hypothetical protein
MPPAKRGADNNYTAYSLGFSCGSCLQKDTDNERDLLPDKVHVIQWARHTAMSAAGQRGTDGSECSPCYDVRRNSMGNISQDDLIAMKGNSNEFDGIFLGCRKDRVVQKAAGKKRCKYQRVDVDHYVEKGTESYMDNYVPMEFFPLPEYCRKMDKAGWEEGKYATAALQKRFATQNGAVVDDLEGEDGVFLDEREYKTKVCHFGTRDFARRAEKNQVDDQDEAIDELAADKLALTAPEVAPVEVEAAAGEAEAVAPVHSSFKFSSARRAPPGKLKPGGQQVPQKSSKVKSKAKAKPKASARKASSESMLTACDTLLKDCHRDYSDSILWSKKLKLRNVEPVLKKIRQLSAKLNGEVTDHHCRQQGDRLGVEACRIETLVAMFSDMKQKASTYLLVNLKEDQTEGLQMISWDTFTNIATFLLAPLSKRFDSSDVETFWAAIKKDKRAQTLHAGGY